MKQSRPRAASAASPINRLVEINENSPERTSQSARDVKRWARLERFRLTREIPKAEQAPFRALLFGHDKLVTADVEGRALPAIRRFHLDQARTTIRSETGNIVAGTITIPSQAAAFSLQITPELEAEIDRLAQGYVTAGMAAHEAADKLDRIKAQSERGKDALQDMFGSIIDGSISAKDAVKQLLLEIVKAQALRGIITHPPRTSPSCSEPVPQAGMRPRPNSFGRGFLIVRHDTRCGSSSLGRRRAVACRNGTAAAAIATRPARDVFRR